MWKSEGSSGLKDHLVLAVGKGFLVSFVNWWKQPSTSKKRNSGETYLIRKPLNCNFKNAVCLTECNICWKQCTDSSKTRLRYSDNNYKKILTVFWRTKNKLPKILWNKKFSTNAFAQMTTMIFKIGKLLSSNKLLTKIYCWKSCWRKKLFALGIIWLWWQDEKVYKSFCWLIRALAWYSQPQQVRCCE